MRSALRVSPVLLLVLAACGSSTTSPAPTITSQPADAVVLLDIGADFAVVASNATSYQWRKNGADIAGATAASYATPGTVAADDHAVYSVVVSGQGGSVTSANAALRVVLPPAITAAPVDTGVLEGGAIHFAVAATGNGTLSYQWRKDDVDLAGATAATLDVTGATAADAGAYTCEVTNAVGAVKSPRTAGPAFLAVLDTPIITLQPVGATLVPGDAWTLRVAATTANSSQTYQWQKDGLDLPGATSDTLGISSAVASDAGSYTCVVSNASSGVAATATSAPAVVAVQLSPMIQAQPGARAVIAGQTATFRVVAKGAGTLSYRWYRGAAAIAGVAGAAASYTTPAAVLGDNGASFHVVVSNGTAPDAVSATATLAVQAAVASLSAGPVSATTSTPVATTLALGEGLLLSWVVPPGSTATLKRGAAAATPVTTGGELVVPAASISYLLAVRTGGSTVNFQVDVAVKHYTPKFLFVANSGSDDISSYAIDLVNAPTIGAPGPTTPAGAAPIHLAVTPDEAHLYAPNSGDGTVSAYAVDAASGALTPVTGSPFALSSPAAAPWASAVNPAGTRLYVACAEGIEVFTIAPATGALTRMPGQAVAIPGRRRGDLVIGPTGRMLYVADAGHAKVRAYAIAGSGALTFSGEAPAGLDVSALALDRTGSMLFARGGSPVPGYNGQLDAVALDGDGSLGTVSTWAGFGPQAQVGGDMPFVRGVPGRHGLATSRRPGFDLLFDAYDSEFAAYSTFSGYVFDRATGGLTAEWVDGVNGFSSPFSVQSFDLVPNGDSVAVDRSGALLALPVASGWNRLYAWEQAANGGIMPVGDGFSQTYQDTGASPAHACFTGTLQ